MIGSVLQRCTGRSLRSVAAALVLLTAMAATAAPPPSRPAPPRPAPLSAPQTYAGECGECHLAYAPRLLPIASWQALMNGLDTHFGVDASLDAETARTITTWLEQSAGRARRKHHDDDHAARAPRAASGQPTLRITETPWFRHEHDEVPAASWKRKPIGSPSNCGACHGDATEGRFDEDAIRIPRP